MMSPIIQYGAIRLLNLPESQDVADEVLLRDVYKIGSIPSGATVLDVGAFYGEFTIACWRRGLMVMTYEPSPDHFEIAKMNLRMNGIEDDSMVWAAVSNFAGIGRFDYNADHPAGSKLGATGVPVPVMKLSEIIQTGNTRYAVKLDCEGAENEIFETVDWLQFVDWLSMEWHNCDGDKYREALERAGMRVQMDADGGSPGGILHARR
jgi:FkbM family methyltransferase